MSGRQVLDELVADGVDDGRSGSKYWMQENMMAMDFPRLLQLTYEIHIPQGLRTNIRGARLDKAVDRITGSVLGAVEGVFPWANRMNVWSEWLYQSRDDWEEVALAKSELNTVERGGQSGAA